MMISASTFFRQITLSKKNLTTVFFVFFSIFCNLAIAAPVLVDLNNTSTSNRYVLILNQPVNLNIYSISGAGPFTYQSGSLPAGMTISISGSNLVLSGTPTVPTSAGSITNIRVRDTSNSIFYTWYFATLASQTITASSTSSSINVGATSTVSASAGSGTGAVTYSSSNTAVATVDSSTGVVTGVSAGSVTITATKAADSTYASATATTSITVTAAQSTNAALSNLVISSGTLSPVFSGGTNSYTASVGNGISSITVTPTVAQPNATVKVNGTTVASGSASGSISLNVGSNTITTVVTAQDGTTTQTYTTTVTRAVAAPTVTSLSPSSGSTLGGTSVTITGTDFTGATGVTIGGAAATSVVVNSATSITATTPAGTAGTASVLVTTPAGSNAANTAYTYVAPASNNANLTGLTLSSGALTPAFASGTIAYTQSVASSVSSITVTPTVSQVNATVTVNGTVVATGVASGSINLNVGVNTITTVVTAQDGTTTKTYTTTVTRAAAASTDATLSAFTISSGTLSPTFTGATTAYTSSVTNATSSITVTPTVNEFHATVTVNGAAVTSASASGSVSLSVGVNTITTVVTAQDGTTTKTYTTTVTRAAALQAQTTLVVVASPANLNATTTTSTLSTSGGSGTGAVSYAITTGTCTLSGATVTAGVSNETCTVTATKAADSTYQAASATVNITVSRRATISAAANDASVMAIHSAQIMQSQKFVTTQIDNIANHLNTYRSNFNLRPSNFGFGVNLPSLGSASQALYKIKDELTPLPKMQAQNKLQSKDMNAALKKVGYMEEQDLTPYNDYMREEELAAEKIKQEQAELELVQEYASNSHYERENLTYSIWTAGTIDYASYKSGDNKDTQNKLTANGLTMGFDYKLHDAAIVGAAVGVGTAWHSAIAINTNLKAKQTALTGYGMFGFADHWVVEGLMGYGVVDFAGNRTTSDGAAQLGVNRKGETYFSSGTVSKMYWVEGYKVTPFVRQDVMHINLHSYAETGAADYALGFDGTNFMHTTTSGGLQLSRDIFLDGAKLTPTAKIALNRIRTGGLAQNIYYADTGAAGGVYTLNQSGSYMTTQSLGLGLVYTTRAGDGFDLGWQGAIGANQYKMNGLRFAVRFAM
jgi:hypothetical protein